MAGRVKAADNGTSAATAGANGAQVQSTNSEVLRRLAVEYRPIDQLIPYARNARSHSDRQVAEIAASIRTFGWTTPVLVDGDNGVIAGHGRLLAARKLGQGSVPVIELSGLSEADKRAYILADNKLALNAGWDEDLLAAEVADLDALGVDLGLAGFAEAEVGSLLDRFHTGTGMSFADDAPPLPDEPVTRAGDVWLLGEHRLVCGDALSADDVGRALDGRLADMIFTDPPYNVDYAGKAGRIANDNLGSAFGTFLRTACDIMLPVTKGAIYICMSSSELTRLKDAFEGAGGHWSTTIIWSKTAFTLGRSDYQRQYEPILYGWPQGNSHYWCGARDQGDVWVFPKPRVNDLHPTMKPVALVEQAIRNSSKSRDIVLDPFAGSGTTLMAAEALGRQAALVELDPGYCDVIVQRWQQATCKTAIRASDGQTFRGSPACDGAGARRGSGQ